MKKYLPILGFCVIIVFFVVKDYLQKKRLDKNHRYSAGIFFKISSSVEGGPLGEYRFIGNEKEYISNIVLNNRKAIEIGKYYLVKFNPDNPNNCEIDISKEISFKTLQTLPDSGWLKPPPFIKRDNIPEW